VPGRAIHPVHVVQDNVTETSWNSA
jgi:hypothetical protein